MKTKINFCNLERNIQSSAMLQMFFKVLLEQTNFSMKCPYPQVNSTPHPILVIGVYFSPMSNFNIF